VLAVVAWNMAERAEIWHVARQLRWPLVVMLATFATVVLRDLVQGIALGCALALLGRILPTAWNRAAPDRAQN
jgi:sulfate permease, SulP family